MDFISHLLGTCGEHSHLNIWALLGSLGTITYSFYYCKHKLIECYKKTCLICMKIRGEEYKSLFTAITLFIIVLVIINALT